MRELRLAPYRTGGDRGPEGECVVGHPDEGVDYRDGLDGGTTSGERGTVKISEVLWSGSVADDGTLELGRLAALC